MRTMQAMMVRGLVLGVALLGGWWASGAAATSDVRMDAPAIAGAEGDDLAKLLEDVQRRAVELDHRERELTQRAAALESLERAVTDALTDLELHDGGRQGGSCRLRGGVTRIYESMRPEEAAQILDQLDDETLRVVFARMDAKQIALIMASMSRERAVAFTKTLAGDAEPPGTHTASR